MSVFTSILLTWVVLLLLCCWCGWGLTEMTLPPALRPFRLACAPLIGYALVIWFGYNAVHSIFNLRQTIPALLLVATVLNVAGVIVRRRRGEALGVPLQRLARNLIHPLVLVLLLALLAGVLPMLHYGYAAVIGAGWDSESYLALSAHLQDFRLAAIGQAPPSPLREHVIDPARIGLSMGHSIVHGIVQLLTHQTGLETFAPLQSFMRALGLVAVYLWLRHSMGLRRWPALWATALTGAGALLLWVSYFNFGMQLAAWPLIGLALVLSMVAVEDAIERGRHAWPGLVLAAAIWDTMAMTYYPALTAAVPMAVALAIVVLVNPEQTSGWNARSRAALAMLVIVLLAIPLSTWVIPDYFAGFKYRYANALTTLGLFRFIPLSDMLGWTPFHLRDAPDAIPAPLVLLAMAATVVLAGAALLLGPRRARWLAAIAGAAVYLLWVRYGRVYHYAYMKGGAYVGFAGAGLLAAGAQGLAGRLGRRWVPLLATPLVALLLLAGWSQGVIVAQHWDRSALVAPEISDFDRSAASLMPRNASVLLQANARWDGVPMSFMSASLYPRQLMGHVTTAYSQLDDMPAGEQPDYVLVAEDEGPPATQLPEARLVWNDGVLALYALPKVGHPSLLLGRDDQAAETANHQLSGGVTRNWGGQYRLITPDKPLVIHSGARLGYGPATSPGQQPRQVTLNLANLEAVQLTLAGTGRDQIVALPPGASTVTVVMTNPELELRSTGTTAFVWARAVDVPAQAESLNQPVVTNRTDQIVWKPRVSVKNGKIINDFNVVNRSGRALRFELSVVSDQFTDQVNALTVLASPPISGTLEWTLDLTQRTAFTTIDNRAVPALGVKAAPAVGDNSYLAVVAVLDGDTRIATVPLWEAKLVGGKPTNFLPWPVTIESAPLGPAPRDDARRDLPLGDGATRLLLAQMAPVAAHPDRLARAELLWRMGASSMPVPAISIQVLGPNDHKWGQWDGPLGGWHSTAPAHPGELVRQDVPIPIDKAAPPGQYRVLLVAYDAATHQPILLGGQAALELQILTVGR